MIAGQSKFFWSLPGRIVSVPGGDLSIQPKAVAARILREHPMSFDVEKTSSPCASQDAVRRRALQHLANVLGVHEASLSQMISLNSDLGVRQLKIMRRELKEVADEQLLREMELGTLLITLHTYCVQMARCSVIDPEKVARVLGVSER